MKVILQASVPTVYQLRSLSRFGLTCIPSLDGSYSISKEFDSEEEAKEYLRDRAGLYADDEEELLKMYDDIELGYLRLDAATANINVLE